MTWSYIVSVWDALPDQWGVAITYMVVLYGVSVIFALIADPDGRR